ncbi:hypothetical protein CBL_07257 [Carabus blaptoides fortunei]
MEADAEELVAKIRDHGILLTVNVELKPQPRNLHNNGVDNGTQSKSTGLLSHWHCCAFVRNPVAQLNGISSVSRSVTGPPIQGTHFKTTTKPMVAAAARCEVNLFPFVPELNNKKAPAFGLRLVRIHPSLIKSTVLSFVRVLGRIALLLPPLL